jgi:NADPH-dependent 2,4-dienoyl-CoA reductase/sulfur reductase-like enzyme
VVAPGFVAIGSGPAGLSAAETFRSRHPHIPVRILTFDSALPYAKPPLSKGYLRGREDKHDLHSAGWFVRNNVDLIRGVTVEAIDVANQEVVTAGGRRYPYWHLVVAAGATAVHLDVPGAEAALTLRSFADAVALKMAARYADSAVVIGGGLIGCEAAVALAGLGVATTMVAAESVPLQRRFGLEVGERVEKILSDNGVRFIGETTVSGIDDTQVLLDDGAGIDSDLVVAATGVRPDIRLADDAGLETRDGRIVVDEHMHASARNVYAAGDIALAHNVTAGRCIRAEHWRDAAQEGLVAGLTAAGFPAAWDQVPGFSCTIGDSVLKYRGWGTGFDCCRLIDHRKGFTVWYMADGDVVGVLTLNADDDFAHAEELLRADATA